MPQETDRQEGKEIPEKNQPKKSFWGRAWDKVKKHATLIGVVGAGAVALTVGATVAVFGGGVSLLAGISMTAGLVAFASFTVGTTIRSWRKDVKSHREEKANKEKEKQEKEEVALRRQEKASVSVATKEEIQKSNEKLDKIIEVFSGMAEGNSEMNSHLEHISKNTNVVKNISKRSLSLTDIQKKSPFLNKKPRSKSSGRKV